MWSHQYFYRICDASLRKPDSKTIFVLKINKLAPFSGFTKNCNKYLFFVFLLIQFVKHYISTVYKFIFFVKCVINFNEYNYCCNLLAVWFLPAVIQMSKIIQESHYQVNEAAVMCKSLIIVSFEWSNSMALWYKDCFVSTKY